MLPSLLITLREGLEAALLLGLLLAVLARAGDTLAAAAVLAGMIVWMGCRAHALRGELGGKVAAAAGSAAALFWLGFVLVVREGLETGLFLFAAVGEDRSLAALAGGLAGIAMAAGLGYAVYRGGSRLNVRVFFTVLNVILLGFGTYLVLRGVGELGELAAAGEAGELAGGRQLPQLTHAAQHEVRA